MVEHRLTTDILTSHEQSRESARIIDATEEGQKQLWNQLIDHRNFLASWSSGGDTQRGYQLIKDSRAIPVTDRSIKQIASMHDMTETELLEELSGKTVLDIGAGKSHLAETVEALDSSTSIISLDISPEALKESSSKYNVIANAEHLPFANGSFDEILLSISLPFWAQSPEQVERFMAESVRVLKPGGKILISPISGIENRPYVPKGDHEINRISQIAALVKTSEGLSQERDVNVLAALADLQVHIIDTLIRYRNNPILDVTIAEAYRDIPIEYSVDVIKTYPPSRVEIVKKTIEQDNGNNTV